ncbi:gp58-like family protein [Streptococcus acidominimus]|uniref:Phage minor structural protein n=2 Tax=Streptococcus acidominimus TaxID=1326 RepID=A0A1Q8EFV2_STRAI|nr:hypothetical protein BU200_01185 [Streptococcus acidominimus]QBX13684.1 hyaluronidase [Streptococcus phage Javan1]SUN05026.1 phage minor structural protein [Streptococcus acidominimus]
MLARDRKLAIRAGKYTSNDIKEASFSYGYISGDTFKPGGTVAGSAKITFTSIITTFRKLDKIYPEIGLLVDNNYEWVQMGEYFINDINIDRNRNTTELDLMDGMFKLNQPYVSDLAYPAQIRDVVREICAKTGVVLETDNLGFRAIQHHIESKPAKKDITFREVLSQAIQLLGSSAFFNRQGKLEIRGLIESNITITADNYFLHGLRKSEIEYQIAGITCKKDKETLTVGLRTGRSLELENSFMIQNILDDLYDELKNLKYYPYSLDWQGHLKLEVGQWVTLKTNKNETYKVPVLSQSFVFKGGLKSKISADSKASNDTQYSYKGFLIKQIQQLSTDLEAEVQQQIEYKDREFDEKFSALQKGVKEGIEQAKAEAEQSRATLATQIESKLAEQRAEAQRDKTALDQRLTASKEELEALIGAVERNMQSGISESYQSLSQALTAYETLVGKASQNALQANTLANTLAGQQNTLSQQLLRQQEDSEGWRNSFESTISEELGRYRNELAQVRGKFDDAGNLTALETYKRTQEESVRGVRTQLEALAQDTARISRIETQADKVVQTVESLNSDVLKKSEFLIEDGRIQFWSGKELNGNNIASMLTVQPEAIRAMTDKLVITSRQTNLVNEKYRNVCTRVSRSEYVMDVPLSIDEREFLITGEAMRVSGSGSLYFYCVVFYSDGSKVGTGYTSILTNTTKAPFRLTSKFTTTSGKTVAGIRFYMNVSSSDVWEVCNLSIMPKMGAELIVDGSITADKLNVNSVRAGILTANSITSNMIQSNAITADKLRVDTALINKLVANDALISNLVSKRAFITAVQAVDLSATRIKSGVLSALNGAMAINLNNAGISFNRSATIDFNSSNNALKRVKNGVTSFLHFNDDIYGGVYAGLGVTSHSEGINSQSSGRFAGIRVFRPNNTIDKIEIYGDTVMFCHGFTGTGNLYWKHTDYKDQSWNLFEILRTFNDNFKNNTRMHYRTL